MTILYVFKNADIAQGSETILRDITWTLQHKNHTWISGPNASGKTMLCKAITGRCRIKNGHGGPVSINYNDIRMVSFTDDGRLFHSINNVHYYQQRFNSWDANGHLTARDYLIARGIDPSDKSNISFIQNIGLSDLLDIERIKLSSGQTRKLLLASALMHTPKLLILDNPYIGLDTESRNYLNIFLNTLIATNDITLIISGQATDLPGCITQQIILQDGQIIYNGPLYKNSIHSFKYNKGALTNIQDYYLHNSENVKIEKVLQLNNINISYGKKSILTVPHWEICKGEKWSLFGPNGSGKSTLVSLIYADNPQVYSQDIMIFEKPPGAGRSIWEIKKQIGFTSPELHAYFRTDLSAEEVVWTGLFDKFEIMGIVEESKKEVSKNLFEYYNLNRLRHKRYASLSTGHQRLCLFMRALIKCPSLLLLDEPFQGMDRELINASKVLINKIINKNQTLLMITHFDDEIPSCVSKKFNLSNCKIEHVLL